jgi:hypothetical protein
MNSPIIVQKIAEIMVSPLCGSVSPLTLNSARKSVITLVKLQKMNKALQEFRTKLNRYMIINKRKVMCDFKPSQNRICLAMDEQGQGKGLVLRL